MRERSSIGTRFHRNLALGLALVAGASVGRAVPGESLFSIEAARGPSSTPALVQRTPDGAVDFRFGKDGRAVVEGMAPRAVTQDALGRLIVVGTSLASPAQPMVQRFSSNGWVDPSFGSGGRSVQAPAGGSASGIDAAVLADGRILVLGQLEDGDRPRPALWTVDAAGRFEPDWLAWIDTPSATALSLVRANEESVMVALGVPRTPAGTLEAFIFLPTRDLSALPERLVQTPAPLEWGTGVRLERDGRNRWRWRLVGRDDVMPVAATASTEADDRPPFWAWHKGALPATRPPVVAAPALRDASGPGEAIYSPFAEKAPLPVVVTTAVVSSDGTGRSTLGWWLAGVLVVALVAFVWKSRGRPDEAD